MRRALNPALKGSYICSFVRLLLAFSMAPNSPSSGNSASSLRAMSLPTTSAPSAVDAKAASFKLLLLVMMVLQNSSTVLVGRFTRAGVPKAELYDVNHLIFMCEFTKFVLSCALEFHTTGGKFLDSLNTHVFERPTDALLILLPALLYLVQNTRLYVALSNLKAPLFQVTYQGKLVTTAAVSVFMLKHKYTLQQWVCLTALSVGVAIVVLGEQQTGGGSSAATTDGQNLGKGLTAVSIACLSSALAGVYFEKVLKRPSKDAALVQPASLWMRNIQLAFFSFVIAWGQNIFATVPTERIGFTYFHGFTAWVWLLVALQAGGGLLVAAVIKYADNVLKGLATGVSVVVATMFSILFFGTPLSSQFTIGAVMILAAVYVFSNPIQSIAMSKSSKNAGNDAELNDLLPKSSDRP
jgi:solute carrier family 35 (UDP-sugar transporter), member A1/2/3